MSWVATVLLSVGFGEEENIAALNQWLQKDCPRRSETVPAGATGVGFLNRLDQEGWGGWKHPEVRLWGGALNHADLDAVVDYVESLAWADPACLQLLIEDQEEGYFQLLMFRGRQLHQFAPPPSEATQP